MQFTQRVRISTGLKCNARCKFCYFHEELNTQEYSGRQIMKMLDLAAEYDIKDIDFSGGEPTIRNDINSLLSYAHSIGFRKNCIITNGIKTSDLDFLKSLIDSGLNEILISIHGNSAHVHDELVGVHGAFSNIIKSLKNYKETGIRFRINCVVNRYNYKSLPQFAEIADRYKPAAFNFISFNDWVNAESLTERISVRYIEASPYLKKTIDLLDQLVPKVTVRYIPFCFMQGYEKHVCNLLQNDYDNDEWNDAVKRLVTDIDSPRLTNYYDGLNATWRESHEQLSSVLKSEERDLMETVDSNDPFTEFPPKLAKLAHKVENYAKRKNYVKGKNCINCSRNLICDGLENTYSFINSTEELETVSGLPVQDPMLFRRGYCKSWA